jgi:sugar/nucleoside kinase (ribokinase family)
MSNILVIGHSVLDKIIYKNKFSENPGGIFHTINTFNNLPKSEINVFLATQIEKKSYKYFSDSYKNVNLDYCEWVNEIPTVTLNLFDNRERSEKYGKVSEKINLPSKLDFSIYDLIHINMVSGLEMKHTDLKRIKNSCKCEIYFDIHTLSRGMDSSGNRVFRKIPDIEKWLCNVDILQMNENEMLTLWGIHSEEENIKKLNEIGIDKTIITKGLKGVTLYYNKTRHDFKALKIDAVNFVGCGDSFGAAFSYHYTLNKNLYSATKFANLVAGIITSYKSLNKIKNLGIDIANRTN